MHIVFRNNTARNNVLIPTLCAELSGQSAISERFRLDVRIDLLAFAPQPFHFAPS
jgi:hypothetical protein